MKYREKGKIQKKNKKSECLTVNQLSALDSSPVYVWRTMVTGSPSYATRSVTLTVVVSTRRQETFTSVSSQTFISFFKQPAAGCPKGRRTQRFFETHKVRFWHFPILFFMIYQWVYLHLLRIFKTKFASSLKAHIHESWNCFDIDKFIAKIVSVSDNRQFRFCQL